MKKPVSKGFSLIELLVSITILGIVMATVFGLFVQITNRIRQRETRQEALTQAERVSDLIAAKISNARGWISGDTLGILLLDGNLDTLRVRWNADSGRIYFNATPIDTSGCVTRFRLQYSPKGDTADATPREQWFEELDHDRDGRLEAGELARTSMVLVDIRLKRISQEMSAQKLVRLPKPVIDPGEVETE
ncbi:MAG: type II secretion system protein [Candidatus Edwardsbacteria bacterium]|nr:type II secretion system protein [Candidatus Edwardsbacteria bacterium]